MKKVSTTRQQQAQRRGSQSPWRKGSFCGTKKAVAQWRQIQIRREKELDQE